MDSEGSVDVRDSLAGSSCIEAVFGEVVGVEAMDTSFVGGGVESGTGGGLGGSVREG
jgi:hypothetical protein